MSKRLFGSSPAVTFRITNNAGEPIAPEDMDYLALSIAGPSSDYTDRATEVLLPVAEDAPPPPLEEADDGAYRYTFQYILAADAEGTYAVSLEGYVMRDPRQPVLISGLIRVLRGRMAARWFPPGGHIQRL
jgi:hypothetical protein